MRMYICKGVFIYHMLGLLVCGLWVLLVLGLGMVVVFGKILAKEVDWDEVKTIFKGLDKDGDRSVEWEEFFVRLFLPNLSI